MDDSSSDPKSTGAETIEDTTEAGDGSDSDCHAGVTILVTTKSGDCSGHN